MYQLLQAGEANINNMDGFCSPASFLGANSVIKEKRKKRSNMNNNHSAKGTGK